MATTAGHFAIQTPRSEAQTINSINPDELTFGSQEASFVSPSKLKQQQTPAPKFLSRLTKPTGNTPLGEIKNNARPARMGKNEFTPMLKSVTKNQFMKRGFGQTPSKLRNGFGKSASTSNLPEMAEMESVDFSRISGEDDGSPTQNENELAEMSSASVSGLKLPQRSPGSNEGAAIMTLREQEKVIDEMRKENFSLKLKIFFMSDRMTKLAPEHIQAVLKENVEFKVEQATLRNELKKYKRSLLDAERNVARMAEEIKATKNSTDPSFVCPLDHGMSEEEAAQLRQAQEEAEENKNEVMFAKKEVEDLKRELWEAKREIQSLENGNPEDVAALESQVEELKGMNEDLDMEVKTLKEEVGQKDDEIDYLQDQLAEEKQKLEEMKSRGPADDDELAKQMEESEREIQTLNQKIAEVEAQLQHARQEFQIEKDQLQSMAAEHKAACEKVEHDLHQLQEAYDGLDKELDEKHEEIESYQRRLAGTDGSDTSEIQNLRREIKDLEEEIKQYEIEKQDMEDQIQTLQRDAAHLLEKDGKMARERSEERKSLQNDIEELQIQLRETIEEKEREIVQYQRDNERIQERLSDAEQQKAGLKKQIDIYLEEENTMHGENAKVQRALREETERHQTEVNSLQRQITQLTADVKEGRKLTEELETEVNTLNEELRTAKRIEDSLNDEIQELREKAFSGGRDSEYLRKMQSENSEFKHQIASLQSQLDSVSAQRDRLTREVNGLQGQLNETRAETLHLEGLEKEFGSVRAERDDLRKSTMAAQINVAKLKAQVNDLTSQNPAALEQKLAVVTRERDTLRNQLDDTKRQLDTQATRLRTVERNLQDARDDLRREQERAEQLLSQHPSSPNTDKTRRLNGEIRKLEDLLQQSRLRQAELGKVNATQLDEIDNLNRRINRLEGELEVVQGAASAQNTQTGRDGGLHKQLTIAKGQLAELKSQVAQQEREFEQRLEVQLSELRAKNVPIDEENAELKEEVKRLKERQSEAVQTKVKLEEQIRSLTRKITRLESDLKHPLSMENNANDKDLFSSLTSLKKELDIVRQDAEQKESKSLKHIRRLEVEIDNLRDHIESVTRELHRTKKDSERQTQQFQLIRRQLQESKDALKRLKARTVEEHAPSALTMQVEKRHMSELKGLGKQIRYLKAKLFREESFRLDLQFAKKFFLMQIGCFESCNKANLHLLQQMGIYPDPAKRAKRPTLRSVALSFIAIARMKRLKDDWAEHRKGGKELKESLKRLRGRKGVVV